METINKLLFPTDPEVVIYCASKEETIVLREFFVSQGFYITGEMNRSSSNRGYSPYRGRQSSGRWHNGGNLVIDCIDLCKPTELLFNF